MNIEQNISIIEEKITDPTSGLPEEIFLLISEKNFTLSNCSERLETNFKPIKVFTVENHSRDLVSG